MKLLALVVLMILTGIVTVAFFETSIENSDRKINLTTSSIIVKLETGSYITVFDFEGHTYLTRVRGGITHSESCRCLNVE